MIVPHEKDHPKPFEHHKSHHVHRYDVLHGDIKGAMELIHDEDKVPLLADVIDEAEEWYFGHIEELPDALLI